MAPRLCVRFFICHLKLSDCCPKEIPEVEQDKPGIILHDLPMAVTIHKGNLGFARVQHRYRVAPVNWVALSTIFSIV